MPPPAAPISPPVDQVAVNDLLGTRLQQANLTLAVTLGLEVAAAAEVAAAEKAFADAQALRDSHRSAESDAAANLERQRDEVRRWAVEAYTSGGLKAVSLAFEAEDINDVPRRLGLARGAAKGVEDRLRKQEEALGETMGKRRALEAGLTAAEQRLAAARAAAAEAATRTAGPRQEVASLNAGNIAGVVGVAFPVPAATSFGDTWGAPRMTGTALAHPHQGTDIFAPRGSPLVAFERGIVTRLSTDLLGGIKLWLVGQSGTRYYYAHTEGYAPGLAEGQVVEVGQTIAYTGNSGNARSTPPHLHFEMHPAGGGPVNPYPVLASIRQASPPR